ncbi:MAG: PIG-L family deacetylase [Sphingomonadales bacterium]
MKRSIYLLLLLLPLLTMAQPTGSVQLYQAIQKLNVLGSVLYIAAHPDDENTRLIAYLANDKLYRTGYLSLTRGDGGQNLIGEEQGIALGLIRTQELLAARRVDGGEQFFTRAYDFGYSKTPKETFEKWDREIILSDVVWVIRRFQPDVIIARFPSTGEGGHGHHTASAILAQEAFEAAADPNRFKEQLKLVAPWKATRLLWNTFNFGGNNTTREDQFKVDVGGFNPLLGKSYGELAAESRSQHKSQGFGVPASRGEAFEFFKTLSGRPPQSNLMDDVTTSWDRISGGAPIKQTIDSILRSFDFKNPHSSLAGLLRLREQMNRLLPDGYWKTQKLKELQALLLPLSGIYAEAFSTQPVAVQGDSVKLVVSIVNRMGVMSRLKGISVEQRETAVDTALATNRPWTTTYTLPIAKDKPLTQPYWLRTPMLEGYFSVNQQQRIGEPENSAAMVCKVTLELLGQSVLCELPVRYKFTDPVKGELYWPLVISAAVMVQPADPVQLIYSGQKETKGSVLLSTLVSGKKVKAGTVAAAPLVFLQDSVLLAKKDQLASVDYRLLPEATSQRIQLTATDQVATTYTQHRVDIRYDHIPALSYFMPAVVQLNKIDLQKRGQKIGFIEGAGDKTTEALTRMGFEVVLLSEKDITPEQLQQYDAIITGVRAYNTHEWLNKVYDRLMQYVEKGGNLIVQYNTSNQIGPVKAQIGPNPFTISRNRITNEKATVVFTDSSHAVFNFPNRLGPADFTDWVQERSVYHAASGATGYQYLISMQDPDEKTDEGSLLVGRYGKGWFTYTGLALFRQLPAGVSGAYRLLANLIALNQQDKHGFQ